MHCIKANFDKIVHALRDILGPEFLACGNFLRPGPKPKFTDLEVVALSLTAECMSIDSEALLFAKLKTTYKTQFPHLISRRQFNDRRKALFNFQEYTRSLISSLLNEINEVYAVDSMPIEICKISRMERNKIGKEDEYTSPDKGFCASQNKFFYGYRLHAACSPNGVINVFNIAKASVHDLNYLTEIKESIQNCILTGDKGYISAAMKEELWRESKVSLEIGTRRGALNPKKVIYPLRRIRKRIETVFSQLCGQFNIQRNYAKSFRGLKTRILAKVSGMTVLQLINKLNNRPIGQLKYALCH